MDLFYVIVFRNVKFFEISLKIPFNYKQLEVIFIFIYRLS